MLLNSKDEFTKCMQNAEKLKDATKGYDGARFTCLSDYKNDLKRSIQPVQLMYEGYLKNYSSEGSLIKSVQQNNKEIPNTKLGADQI